MGLVDCVVFLNLFIEVVKVIVECLVIGLFLRS